MLEGESPQFNRSVVVVPLLCLFGDLGDSIVGNVYTNASLVEHVTSVTLTKEKCTSITVVKRAIEELPSTYSHLLPVGSCTSLQTRAGG